MDSDDELLAGVPGPSEAENKKRKLEHDSDDDLVAGVDKKGRTGGSDDEEGSGDESEGEEVERKTTSKKKKAKDGSRFFADQADDDDDDDSDEEEDDEEEAYESDFVVAEDDDGKKQKEKRQKVERTRLKKNTNKVTLDEEDLAIMQENMADESRPITSATAAGDDEGENSEIEPETNADGAYKINEMGENEMQGFIVDGEDDADSDAENMGRGVVTPRVQPMRQAAVAQRNVGGPSFQEIQESMDIFGVENLDDLDLDIYDDDDDDDDNDTANVGGNVLAQQRETSKMSSLRSNIERQVLVDNFYTDKDEELRNIDIPERYSNLLNITRELPNSEERKAEALWMVHKLVTKLLSTTYTHKLSDEYKYTTANDLKELLQEPTENFLKFTHEDKLEVPFIWQHRRDYLHPILTRELLWNCITWDMEYDRLYVIRSRMLQDIESIFKATEYQSSEFQMDQQSIKNDILSLRGLCAEHEKSILQWTENMNIAMDNIDQNENDDIEQESEREKVLVLKKQIANEEIELSKAKELLTSKQIEQEKQLELSLALDQYTSDGIIEVKDEFPRSRYEYMIESCETEQELKDIQNFLSLLLKGAIKDVPHPSSSKSGANGSSIVTDDSGEGEVGDDDDTPNNNNINMNNKLSKKKKQTQFHDKLYQYSRYRKIPGIRNIIKQVFLSCCDMGDAVKHQMNTELPPTIPGSLYDFEQLCSELIDSKIIKDYKSACNALISVVSCELSAEPNIKNAVRNIYRNVTTISTKPTAKGCIEITPFSEYFGIHFLNHLPVNNIIHGIDNTNGTLMEKSLYLKLIQAEKEGLITIKFDHPINSDNGDINLMPYFEGLDFVTKWFPTIPVDNDMYPEMRTTLDELRFGAFQNSIIKYLLPEMEYELKRDLIRIGKEHILEETTENFKNLLEIGPVCKQYMDPRDKMSEMLISCPQRPFSARIVSIQCSPANGAPLVMVYLDQFGVVCASDLLPSRAMATKQITISKFLNLHKPDIILINSSGAIVAKATQAMIDRHILPTLLENAENIRLEKIKRRNDDDIDYDSDIEDEVPWQPETIILKDDISEIFKNSERGKKMFPDYLPVMRAAICLGRYAQEPLSEFCNLWTSASGDGKFGYEALFLKIHPMLNWTKSIRDQLLSSLERVLVNAVCDVGVDINGVLQYDHLSSMLAFVGGLGLRKANMLRSSIREKIKNVTSRVQLLERRLLKLNVWTNCASFLRVAPTRKRQHNDGGYGFEDNDDDFNPLDNTRIHPECYHSNEWCPKICANAMDNDDWVEGQDYFHIVRSIQKDSITSLEKRVIEGKKAGGRSKAYLDMWLNGGRPSLTATYHENVLTSSGITEERTRPAELQDKLCQLELTEYCKQLEDRGQGKHYIQFGILKEEIRFPWLDLRKPLTSPDRNEMFTIFTGENDNSVYVGLKMGCTVVTVDEKPYFDSRTNETRTRPKALVKTDCGLKGTINMNEVTDDMINESNFNIQDYLQIGSRLLAVVVNVDKYRNEIELSIKPSYIKTHEDYWIRARHENRNIQRWFSDTRTKKIPNGGNLNYLYISSFDENEALNEYRKSINVEEEDINKMQIENATNAAKKANKKSNQRHIKHQLFVNCGHTEAEERLKASLDDGPKFDGNVIIRPSSKGPDSLSITWAFNLHKSWFMHFEVDEKGKKNGDLGLGNELHIKWGKNGNELPEPYSDLDEIYIRFIDPMNDYAKSMNEHRHFRDGTPEEIENWLQEQALVKSGNIPYCIRYEPGMAGMYVLTWFNPQSRSNPIKKAKITLLPTGFSMERKHFTRVDEIIKFLKNHVGGGSNSSSSSSSSTTTKSSKPSRQSRFSNR
jgi:transcriptional accessory protein Tex/SPT6